MDKKETLCIMVMSSGFMIMIIAYLDIVSILTSIFNRLLGLNLPDVFFNSFAFRAVFMALGAIILLIGGLIYKNTNNQ